MVAVMVRALAGSLGRCRSEGFFGTTQFVDKLVVMALPG